MTYEYKRTKCGLKYEYKCSIKEDRPESIECVCGNESLYDWSQFSVSSILIPEAHRA